MPARSTTVAILAAFFAVVAAIVATGFVNDQRLSQIDGSSRRLAVATLPSIERLISMRSSLGTLETQLDDCAAATPDARSVVDTRIDTTLRRLSVEASTYAATAAPGDRDARELRARVDALAAAIARTIERERDAPGDALRATIDRDVHPAIAAVDGSVRALLESHTASAEALASRIEGVRVDARSLAVALDAACVLIAIAAAFLTVRGVRRFTALLIEHGRLVEARANELSQFSARVAHDILSPLTAVSFGIAHAKRVANDPGAMRSLDRASSSLERVRQIVDSLYDFARSGASPSEAQVTDVAAVIAGVIDEARVRSDELSIDVRTDVSPELAVACARGVLVSVVSNLVRNAIKYIDGGHARRVTVRARASSANAVRIEVEDTGPGIPAGAAERIFQPYVRASNAQGGIGLGLATVKKLVVAHGGAVGVVGAPGGGACFYVELPRAAHPTTGVTRVVA